MWIWKLHLIADWPNEEQRAGGGAGSRISLHHCPYPPPVATNRRLHQCRNFLVTLMMSKVSHQSYFLNSLTRYISQHEWMIRIALPVPLLSWLGLTGGPRVAVQGAVSWIMCGLSVVPEVSSLLQWTFSGSDLHTNASKNPDGGQRGRAVHSETYSRCTSNHDTELCDSMSPERMFWSNLT